jgi:hypothetical protein
MIEQYLVKCKMRAVYMAVTDDRYGLPIAIGDSMSDIARTMGVERSCVCKQIHGSPRRKYKKGYKFVRVYVEDDSRDENKNGNLPG